MLKGCEWHQFPWNGEKSCRNSRITAVRSAESAEFLSTVFRATVIGGKSEISEVKAVERFADSKAPPQPRHREAVYKHLRHYLIF